MSSAGRLCSGGRRTADSCFITDQLCRFRALSLIQSHTLSFTYYNAGQHYLGPHQRAVMLLIAVLSQYYRPRAYTPCIAETHDPAQRHIICVVRELRTPLHDEPVSVRGLAHPELRPQIDFPSHIHQEIHTVNKLSLILISV